MAFKMKGSPATLGTISGTAGHSSALKMRASALKQEEDKKATPPPETKSDPYADALKKDPNLPEYIETQQSTDPGSDKYEANQAKINAAYGKVWSQTLKKAQIKNVKAKTKTQPTEATVTPEPKKKSKLGKFCKNVGAQLKRGTQRRKDKKYASAGPNVRAQMEKEGYSPVKDQKENKGNKHPHTTPKTSKRGIHTDKHGNTTGSPN